MILVYVVVMASIFAVGLGTVAAGRFVLRGVFHLAERRVRRRLVAAHHRAPIAPESSSRAPAVVAGIQVLILVALVLRNWETHWPLVALASIPMLGAAYFLHGMPQHSRTAKYIALWMGVFGVQLAFGMFAAVEAREANSGDPRDGWYVSAAIMPVALLAGACISRLVSRTRANSARPRMLAFAMHRVCMALIPATGWRALVAALAMRMAGLMPGYLAVRYFLHPRVARSPFLYLRSFRDAAAQRFFATTLAPSLGSRGVVVALVHEEQTRTDLNRRADQLWHAETYELPDSAWRDWVTTRIESSVGVVIDMSRATDSMEWELNEAIHHLPPERILIVYRNAVPRDFAVTGVSAFQYADDSLRSTRAARNLFAEWADAAIRSATQEPGTSVGDGARRFAAGRALLFAATALVLAASVLIASSIAWNITLAEMVARSTWDDAATVAWQHVWGIRVLLAEIAAYLLLAVAAPRLTFGGALPRSTERLCFAVPCILGALLNACTLSNVRDLALPTWSLGMQAILLIVGYLVVRFSYIGLRCSAPAPVERIVNALLLPMWMELVRDVLQVEAFATATPILALWGGLLVWIAGAVAVFAMLRVVAWPRSGAGLLTATS